MDARKAGFYWVFYGGKWTIAEYCVIRRDRFWQLVGSLFAFTDAELGEIDETPIARKPMGEF